MEFIRYIDVPTNALPSGHVVYSMMGPIFLLKYSQEGTRKRDIRLFIIGSLIALSTLTTKQHHFPDLFTGLALAWLIGTCFGANAKLLVESNISRAELIREKIEKKEKRKKEKQRRRIERRNRKMSRERWRDIVFRRKK